MEINGFKMECDRWTNNLNELVFIVDEYIRPKETVLKEENGSSYVYGESENGFVTYGIIEDGYRWSSRASVFNAMFKKRIVDNVAIKAKDCKYAVGMTVENILPYLTQGYYILEQVETDNKGNVIEVSYYISNTKHERENQFMFRYEKYNEGGERFILNRIYP